MKKDYRENVIMPHVVVKLWPGRNDEIKTNLAEKLAIVVSEFKERNKSC